MGLELRKVIQYWYHPKAPNGGYIPLHDRYGEAMKEWMSGENDVPKPLGVHYMPDWPEKDRTHFQMYENVTEGTPVSPIMETAEALAEWLEEHVGKK